ncbi:MAG: glycosyl hydrolase [Candidatus Margulisiibacteriota bacterium]
MKLDGNFSGCALGAYVNGIENLADFQTQIGKNLAVVLWYVHWPASASAGKPEPFPAKEADQALANGSVPLITWEPWVTHTSGTLAAIVIGEYEDYVTGFLRAAKEWGKPLFLRFAHEMNGNWYPWDGSHNGSSENSPEKYKQAWLYIYNVKERLKADNVKLVWSPNNTSQPDASWNKISKYYPGDQYVDWISLDGYNWGYGSWETFAAVFKRGYQELTALTDKPLMIGEFASAEQGGSKASWIKQALSQVKEEYPRIKLFCWFNINKERDWRINSSDPSAAAFKQAIGDRYFLENLL